jgi:hypothetical protein
MAQKSATALSLHTRKHIRFAPDQGTVAQIDLDATNAEFNPVHTALIAEESFGGVGLVLMNTPKLANKLQIGDRIKVQVGKLDPMQAEIRWRVDLDSRVIRLGIMYLE